MSKLTRFELSIIIDCLKHGKSIDIKKVKSIEKKGKTPFFTQEYINDFYEQIIDKIQKMKGK